MFIKLTDTFDSTVEQAIKIAKENNLTVIFERDGVHGTDDLAVILKFQNAGFSYKIRGYKGICEDNAIRVEFHYSGK
jgi:hypothetical protein